MWNIFQAIKRSWLKHFVTQMSAIFILTITYTASLFIVLSMLNIKNIFYAWGEINEMTVYFKDRVDLKKADVVIKNAQSRDFIESVQYISSKKSAQEFQKRFAKHTPQNIEANKISQFFPATLRIKLAKPIQTDSELSIIKGFSEKMNNKYNIIEDILYGQTWMMKYVKLLSGFEAMSWFLVVTIFFTSLFVSMNVLKTVIYSRKEEIEILEFIGATSFWIYAPPVLNACVLSGIAFFTACFTNLLIYSGLSQVLSQMFSDYIIEQARFFTPTFLASFFLLLMMSVFLTSLISIGRFSPEKGRIQ